MNHLEDIDKILGIEPKDKGTKVLKLIDVNKAKQAIDTLILRGKIGCLKVRSTVRRVYEQNQL